jgi:hypothetical protein
VRSYPDKRYYQRIAIASSYPLNPLERVFRLAALLDEIVRALPGELLLRGGTALNLLHLDAPRLSVDLDLDYIGSAGGAAAATRRPALLAELEHLCSRAGYAVEHSRSSYAMSHLVLRFANANGTCDAMKIDVNFLDRVPVIEPVRLPLRHPFGDDLAETMTTTFALSELAASKAIALARRGLARDLYDVAQISRLPGLDLTTVRTVLVVRGAAYPPPSPEQYSVEAGSAVRLTEWRSQVVALVRRRETADLAEARRRVEGLLREFVRLAPCEVQFLRSLESGSPQAVALGDDDRAARVQANPGLLWRLERGASLLEER